MTATHLETIGKQLKTARLSRKMTQEELAEKAILRRATIVDIEAGKSNFEINTLVRIADALNYHIEINLYPA